MGPRANYISGMCAAILLLPALHAADLSADEIVRRSVANNNADWREAPKYSFTERDVITKGSQKTNKQYRVVMIDGSTYNKLVAINGEPLSSAQAAEEERKLQREISRRKSESAEARRKRVGQFQAERRQDHALLTEMVKAFQYRSLGQETVNGRRCFVIEATPKPGYRPPNRDTKVLTAMRGKLWVDAQQFQWVRVHAEVFRPVTFGLFVAQALPGTEFTLEEAPVAAGVWLPSHFITTVKASVLHVWSRNSRDEEFYSDYRPTGDLSAAKR